MSLSNSRTTTRIKNRAPAAIQISAEQIVREAADRQEAHVPEPIVKIHDAEEYQAHLRDRRKQFEDNIRYRREHIGNWVKYARFEEENKEYERARSVMERALEVEHRSAELWLRYAELELRNEFVNHARNVLDRAVQILPRVDFLWYKYVFIEESVGDIPKCRAVFQRWMKWHPDDNAWLSFARFETRHGSGTLERAEAVMRNYVNTYPSARSFLRFAKWAEHEAKQIPLARTIFEAALSELPPEEVKQARVFMQFASFEARQREYERARVIYRHAIDLLKLGGAPRDDGGEYDDLTDYEKSKRDELYKAYITFEKKHGDREGIEELVLTKHRAQYKKRMEDDPYDYDGWFEWAKMEQESNSESSTVALVRDIYERAVSHAPPFDIKDDWRRYIYLWIYYAVYEELTNRDLDRASKVYQTCISLIPHRKFSFAKIWILAAQLQVRRKDLAAARKLFGQAIGRCGKEKIYKEYIAMELALGEVDRCRTLYNNYLKAMPHNCQAWCKYAQLEKAVGETERCRALYELAIAQPALDMPELLWKGYIDFEIEEGESDRARALYERLLEKTGHVKVWISWAQYEATERLGGKGLEEARRIFGRGYQQLKAEGLKDERVLLLDEWRVLEKSQNHNNNDAAVAAAVAAVEAKMPRRIKRRRPRPEEDGAGWEEYFEYQFPDDVEDGAAAGNFKILEMAAKWKEQQKKQQQLDRQKNDDSDLDSDEEDDDGD